MLVNINIYKHIDPHNYKILEGISPGACTKKLFTAERFFTRAGSGLTRKHETRLERLARDKHLSLLRKSVNYGRKSFIVQAPEVLQEKYVGGGGFVYLLSFLCTCPSGGSSKCQ
jgi:hypothetical protein